MESYFPGFPPEGLRFFRQLKRNNNREWFRAHKDIYEQKVKLPKLLPFIIEHFRAIMPFIRFLNAPFQEAS